MRFLVDESVEYPIVRYFRKNNHDTLSVAESYKSLDDKTILNTAHKQKRILVTNDTDFGELVFRHQFKHRGIILLRLSLENTNAKIVKLQEVLAKYKRKLKNNFVVITDHKIRIRKSL